MEQRSTRTSQVLRAPRAPQAAQRTAGRPRLPRPARSDELPDGGTATVYRTQRRGPGLRAPGWLQGLRRLRPSFRLTGLGAGVLGTLTTLIGGVLDAWWFDGPGVLFGLVFMAASVAAGVWVRPQDLGAAPVSAPIAFAVALALTGEGQGFAGHAMGLVTGLALHTGWLYSGTLAAAAVAGVRKVLLLRRG